MKKYANHTPADQGIRVARLDNHTPDEFKPCLHIPGNKNRVIKEDGIRPYRPDAISI